MLTTEERAVVFDKLWRDSFAGLAIVAEDGTFTHANDAFCTFLEYSEVELRNRKFKDVTHPDDLEADLTLAARAARTMEPYTMRKRYITKRGKVVWAILRVSPIHTEENGFEMFLSQISELVALGSETIQSLEKTRKRVRARLFLGFLKDNWSLVLFALAALAFIAERVLK